MARNKTGSYLPVLEAFIVVTVIIAALDAAAGLLDALTTENVFGLAVPLPGNGVQDLVPSNVVLERARAVVDAPTGLGFRLAWWLVGGGTSILVVIGGLQGGCERVGDQPRW